MADGTPQGRSEWRTPPPELAAYAAEHPGGSVAEIDTTYVDDPNGYVPPEAISGAWVVDPDGKLTGEFVANPHHGPPQSDFAMLTDTDHWLDWLPADPAKVVEEGITEALTAQVPESIVDWMKVISAPEFLTGGIPQQSENGDAEQSVLVVRAAMAVPFALSVHTPDRPRAILWGAYSWVAVNLHEPELRRDRTWFDLWITRDRAAELLHERVYSVGTEDEDSDGPIEH